MFQDFLFLLSSHYILLMHYLLIYELSKALEIRYSIVFNLSFPNNTIFLCFFYLFFIIDLHFLSAIVIAQNFNPTAETVIPTGTQTNEANAETGRQLVTFEATISKCST